MILIAFIVNLKSFFILILGIFFDTAFSLVLTLALNSYLSPGYDSISSHNAHVQITMHMYVKTAMHMPHFIITVEYPLKSWIASY